VFGSKGLICLSRTLTWRRKANTSGLQLGLVAMIGRQDTEQDMTELAKMESGDYSPDFSLESALKDLDLARAATGIEVIPVAGSIADRWRRLVVEGYGRLDISAARLGLGSARVTATNGHEDERPSNQSPS
jgi:3-hydroxyisobutyrate dehydrogenase-like beta-hydroxyacid dehydrogenase